MSMRIPNLLVLLLAGSGLALLVSGCRPSPEQTAEEMYQHALLMESQRLTKEAGHWYRKAAHNGHPLAQLDVAFMYRYGDAGHLRDPYEAERWFGALGRPRSRTALADFGDPSDYGASGVLRDEKAAEQWFRTAATSLRDAAEAGDLEAQFYLGSLYVQGAGVRRDGMMALRLWTDAAEKGYAPAQYWLALAYLENNNIEAAEAWLHEASKKRYAPAQFRLSMLYQSKSDRSEADQERAMRWLREAAAREYVFAQRQLAVLEADAPS